MIIFITGVPGSFKTLFAMDLLTKDDFKDRPVYSNIDGADHLPIPNDDWRDTPEGSLVIYDEAQSFFPSTGRAGNSSDPRIIALDQHRHTGHDLIFITQRYSLVHHHIRGFVGRHYHLVRKTKSVATLYTNGEAFNPDDKKMIKTVTSSVFTAPSHLFDKYKSASLHTKVQTRLRLPLWFWFAIIGFFLGLAAVYYFLHKSFLGATSTSVSAVHSVADVSPSPAVANASPVLAGCISSANSCLCYSSTGAPLKQSYTECRHSIVSHDYISLAVSKDSEHVSSVSRSNDRTASNTSAPSSPPVSSDYSRSDQLQPNYN